MREPRLPRTHWGPLKPVRPIRTLLTCPSLTPGSSVRSCVHERRAHHPVGTGSNFAIRRHVLFDRVGPFDNYLGAGALFPSAEDTDYKLQCGGRRDRHAISSIAQLSITHGIGMGYWRVSAASRDMHRNGALARTEADATRRSRARARVAADGSP